MQVAHGNERERERKSRTKTDRESGSLVAGLDKLFENHGLLHALA